MSTASTQPVHADHRIRLSEVLPDAKLVGAEEIYFQSCCGDWQDCEQDDLFVAVVDADHDGHEFTAEAIRRGAGAIVTERLIMTGRPQCIVSDTREAYGRICQALAGQPSQRLSTIGVSGSDGKTVVCHLVRRMLALAGRATGLVSSLEIDTGDGAKVVPDGSINSASLAQQLAQMALSGCKTAVLELPSVALAQRSNCGVDLDVAVLTNIRSSDLSFHGSLANYRRSQIRLLGQLKSSGIAVINADDPTSHFLLEKIKSPVLTFGMKHDANVTATVVRRSETEQTFLLNAGGESIPVRTSVIGDHHVQNCLAAATVGLAVGLDLVTIATGLDRCEVIPGRMEQIRCGQEFGVWIDAARTPNQLANALQAIKQVSSGSVWALCSVDGVESAQEKKQLGEVAERTKVNLILTRANNTEIVDFEPIHQVLDGVENPNRPRVMPNRFKAIEWVLQNASPGDSVLITGCGNRPIASVGEGGWAINDKDVCQAWLYDNASLAPVDPDGGLEPGIYNIDDYREC